MVNYINNSSSENEKFIIAPHNINPKGIKELQNSITKKTVLFSDKEIQNITDTQVFIVDIIGILTKIYSVADIAYVGGGLETGLHNVLEPATFGNPILIGPKHDKFNEAVDLVNLGGCIVVNNQEEFNNQLERLFSDADYRQAKGKIAGDYITNNIGATNLILEYINTKISKN